MSDLDTAAPVSEVSHDRDSATLGMLQQASNTWGATARRAITLQWCVVGFVAGGAALLGGGHAALASVAGGASVALPNALLAFGLWLRVRRVGTLSVNTFVVGEGVKLLLTLLALVCAVKYAPTSLLALVVGMIAALKAQWLALWFTRYV